MRNPSSFQNLAIGLKNFLSWHSLCDDCNQGVLL